MATKTLDKTTAASVPAPAAPADRPVPGHVIYRRVKRERLAYTAAATAIAAAPQFPALWPAHAAVLTTAAGTGVWLYGHHQDDDHFGLIQRAAKALPVLTGAGLYLVNLVDPGAPWWEYAAAGAWAAVMSWLAPNTRSQGFTLELPPPPAAPQRPALTAQAGRPGSYTEFLARQWEAAALAPDTRLANITQYRADRPDFEAVVVARQGKPVPHLTPTALAAVFDFPEGTVTLAPIPGSGPGRMKLTATPTLTAADQPAGSGLQGLWNTKVAGPGGAAPGMILAAYRTEPNRIALRVTAPEGELIHLPQKQIARALGMKNADLLMVETDGLGDGLVSIYDKHPLIDIREATAADLVMDADGRIQIGLRHDGRPARIPLYDPQMGAITDLLAGAPGAGKSVTLNTILAAERINGIVSIVADAQDGMSLPEADGRVYHFGKGIAATGATLAAAHDLARYREKISAENGWGSFEIGNPWPLVNVTLDELNRILSAEATVPRPFRKWVTGMVGDTQSTGRKLGEGIRFAAQSIHLADLGDKDKIRANAKNGTVWLGRVNSSTTQHMAADGVLPPGIVPESIPRYFKTGSDIDAAFNGREAAHGPITAGLANIIQGGSLFVARTFKAVKKDRTYPGLIALYESAPIPRLTPEEHQVFQESYAYWLPYAEDLLAGTDPDGDSDPDAAYADTDYLDPIQSVAPANAPAASAGNVKDRILAVLRAAAGPMRIKDIRSALPDVATGTVNNVVGQLRDTGHITAVSRGTYQITEN